MDQELRAAMYMVGVGAAMLGTQIQIIAGNRGLASITLTISIIDMCFLLF